MKSASEDEIIAHCEAVARAIPLVGFYLQPAVGGVILSAGFWRRFAAIDNVIAIKIAPFNRYRTLDVLRGVAAAGALDRVALYTGNDDHILLDLMPLPQTQAASSNSRWICRNEVDNAFTVSGMKRATNASARIQIVP